MEWNQTNKNTYSAHVYNNTTQWQRVDGKLVKSKDTFYIKFLFESSKYQRIGNNYKSIFASGRTFNSKNTQTRIHCSNLSSGNVELSRSSPPSQVLYCWVILRKSDFYWFFIDDSSQCYSLSTLTSRER